MKTDTQREIAQAEAECERLLALWHCATERLEQLRAREAREWAQRTLAAEQPTSPALAALIKAGMA